MKYRHSTDAVLGWFGVACFILLWLLSFVGFILLWLLRVVLPLGLIGTVIWAIYHIVTKYVINA